jgi:phospholipid/cholesterol/gamma-HCH transport system ATP-binding protein
MSSDVPFIEFQRVSLSFGDKRVLEEVSFQIMEGETVCVLGRSGVGKSVALRISIGFLKPDHGRVISAGEDITFYDEDQLQRVRKKVSMVFQGGALFDSLTVRENVAFPLREHGQLSEQAIFQIADGLLEMVHASHLKDMIPTDVSTGAKRSVAIARALAAQPESILYDEPTTMVDPLSARVLVSLIGRLKQELKLTSIVVTHDMRVVEQLADRVVFLEDGHVVFSGTKEQMKYSPEPIVRAFIQLDRLDLSPFLLRAAS